MSTQDIVARIISDANAEADELIKTAENRAQKLATEATAYAEAVRKETERETEERTESILCQIFLCLCCLAYFFILFSRFVSNALFLLSQRIIYVPV